MAGGNAGSGRQITFDAWMKGGAAIPPAAGERPNAKHLLILCSQRHAGLMSCSILFAAYASDRAMAANCAAFPRCRGRRQSVNMDISRIDDETLH